MSRAHPAVPPARAIVVLALVSALAACADAPTAAPAPPPNRATRPAVRDGDPPDTPCFSGWVVVNGIWTCFDS